MNGRPSARMAFARKATRAGQVRQHQARKKRRSSRRSPTTRRPLGRGRIPGRSFVGSPIRQWDASASAAARTGVVTINLPALHQIRPGWRLASLAVFLLAASALWYLLNEPQYHVYGFELSGANRVPEAEIYLAAGVDAIHIAWIDPAEVAEKVAALPDIASAEVTVDFPARVVVTVGERVPVVVWRQSDQSVWVDAQGVAFEPREDPPGLLPIEVDDAARPLTIVPDQPVVPVEVIAGALQLKELRSNIELLHYDSLHGLSYQDGRGWRGYFGTGTDMDVKLLVYETLVDNLLERQIRPAVVSVEYVDNPFYRR